MVSFEAGMQIMALQSGRSLTSSERAEVAHIRRSVATMRQKPQAITPIIFPCDAPAPLSTLIAPHISVSFDLAGDGGDQRWPWVGPNTGILVWDPEETGRIRSGRQLFGSVTWWMFWEDGYKALAALDDDQNGWLEGAELEGLAVWCDRNGNGVSDRGEVRPLPQLGITRVAVRPSRRSHGTLWTALGLQRRNGSYLPTYDWAPASVPTLRQRVGVP